jgi:hypothetical protein
MPFQAPCRKGGKSEGKSRHYVKEVLEINQIPPTPLAHPVRSIPILSLKDKDRDGKAIQRFGNNSQTEKYSSSVLQRRRRTWQFRLVRRLQTLAKRGIESRSPLG